MKLLSAGTTFGEAKDGPSEFKMQQEFLPKFSPAKKSPFAAADKPAPVVASRESLVSGVTFSSARVQLTSYPKTKPSRGLLWALQGLFGRGGAFRKKTAPLVQTEWALEQVKVVRNDLSDTDIFVRTAIEPTPSAATLPNPAETVATAGSGKKQSWGRAVKPWAWFK